MYIVEYVCIQLQLIASCFLFKSWLEKKQEQHQQKVKATYIFISKAKLE